MDLQQRIIDLEIEVIETRKAATNLLLELLDASTDAVTRDKLLSRLTRIDTSPEGERIQRLVEAKISNRRH